MGNKLQNNQVNKISPKGILKNVSNKQYNKKDININKYLQQLLDPMLFNIYMKLHHQTSLEIFLQKQGLELTKNIKNLYQISLMIINKILEKQIINEEQYNQATLLIKNIKEKLKIKINLFIELKDECKSEEIFIQSIQSQMTFQSKQSMDKSQLKSQSLCFKQESDNIIIKITCFLIEAFHTFQTIREQQKKKILHLAETENRKNLKNSDESNNIFFQQLSIKKMKILTSEQQNKLNLIITQQLGFLILQEIEIENLLLNYFEEFFLNENNEKSHEFQHQFHEIYQEIEKLNQVDNQEEELSGKSKVKLINKNVFHSKRKVLTSQQLQQLLKQ